jgi:type VI secretion system protein ImpF
MAREHESTVRPSVLDRLLQGESGGGGSLRESVDAVRASVLRDLDWLLNTRRTSEPAPAVLTELRHSLYHYGLRDLTSHSADHSETPTRLAREIEELIRVFEPRLSGVRVRVPEEDAQASAGAASRRRMHFRIEATLDLDPEPQDVVFDTVLDVARGSFQVGAQGHA